MNNLHKDFFYNIKVLNHVHEYLQSLSNTTSPGNASSDKILGQNRHSIDIFT